MKIVMINVLVKIKKNFHDRFGVDEIVIDSRQLIEKNSTTDVEPKGVHIFTYLGKKYEHQNINNINKDLKIIIMIILERVMNVLFH